MCRKASYNQNGQAHDCDPLHRFNSLLHGRKLIKIILIVVVICGMTSFPLYFKLKDTSIRIDKILSTNWAQMYWNARPTKKPNKVVKEYDLRIMVITYNRAKSLMRLLNSINKAKYFNDSILLEVWIDRSKDGKINTTTLKAANKFKFTHGEYSVNCQPYHAGIIGQWIHTWKPSLNSSEIGVILEDDLSVSPYFYKWLKIVHQKYDNCTDINGYALQGVSIKHNGEDGYVKAPKESIVYRYPTLGTWGFSPTIPHWLAFKKWFDEVHTEAQFHPLVPGNVATDWYLTFLETGKTEGMWEMWHIYYAWKHKENTLYSNLGGHNGLTINHREAGLHYSGSETKQRDPLLTEWKDKYEELPDDPVRLDNSGQVIVWENIRMSFVKFNVTPS